MFDIFNVLITMYLFVYIGVRVVCLLYPIFWFSFYKTKKLGYGYSKMVMPKMGHQKNR